jgi:hypothetical protein
MAYVTCVAGTVITASWANQNVRDQTTSPHATSAARAATITVPVEGMVTYLSDRKVLEVYTGSGYQPVGGGVPICVIRRVATQSLPYGVTTAIEWDTEDKDDWDSHSLVSNVSRIIPQRPGWYGLSACVEIAYGGTESGFHSLITAKNGIGVNDYATGNQIPPVNGVPTRLTAVPHAVLFNGSTDYFQLGVLNASGGSSLNATAYGTLMWMGI